RLTHSPFFTPAGYRLLVGTDSFPGDAIWRRVAPSDTPVLFLVEHPLQVLRKGVAGLAAFRGEGLSAIDPIVAFAFAVLLFAAFFGPRWRGLFRVQALGLLLFVVLAAFTQPETRMLAAWAPLLCIGAAAAIAAGMERLAASLEISRGELAGRLGVAGAYGL